MGFSNLSNELILMIWDLVEIEDVYSFSTISKRVYLLVREALREHCELSNRISTISNVNAESGDPSLFGRLLKEILLNPRAARYPSVLELDEWRIEWEDEGGHCRSTVTESDLELFKQAAKANMELFKKDMEEDWFATIDEGDEEPLIAILLLLLPNLRRIRVGSIFESWPRIMAALRTIRFDESGSALRKLHSVELECTSTPDGDLLDFELVKLFAALPSVKRIHSIGVGTDPEDRFHILDSLFSENKVESLSFVGCRVDPKSMSEFLSTNEDLQHFFYTPDASDGDLANFDPYWICSGLLNARHTLRTLSVLSEGQRMCFMGSLVGFICLEFLQTDLQLLIGDLPRQVDGIVLTLPESIVRVRLHVDYPSDSKYYKGVIQEIADSPTDVLQLEKVEVVGVADAQAAGLSNESLTKALAERGVRLSFETEKRSLIENWPDEVSRA